MPAEPGDTLGSVGYRNGDQCAFTYLGPAEEDLRPEFRAAEDVSVSSSDDEEDDGKKILLTSICDSHIYIYTCHEAICNVFDVMKHLV